MTSYLFTSSFENYALVVELPRGGYVQEFGNLTKCKFSSKSKLWSYVNSRFKGYSKYKLVKED